MFFRLSKYIYCSLFFFVLSVSNDVIALELGPVSISGYLTQNFIYTEGNEYLGSSKNGSFDYGEAAVNIFYRPSNRSFLSAQLISRNISNYDKSEDDLKLEYGVFGYTLISERQFDITARVGRLKYPYALYNDIQGVSNVVPSVLMPQILYYDYFRHENILDGWQIESNFRLNDFGDIRLDFTRAKRLDVDELESLNLEALKSHLTSFAGAYGILLTDIGGQAKADPVNIMRIFYYSANGRLTLGYSKSLPNVFTITAEHSLASENAKNIFTRETCSLEYFWDKYSVIAERHLYKSKTDIVIDAPSYGGVVFQHASKAGVKLYYVQMNYQINKQWNAYLRNERLHPDSGSYSDDMPKYHGIYESWVVGGTYQVTDNLHVRAEFHNIEGAVLQKDAVRVGIIDAAEFDKYWTMFAMQVSYSF